jgi:hypothetical protein
MKSPQAPTGTPVPCGLEGPWSLSNLAPGGNTERYRLHSPSLPLPIPEDGPPTVLPVPPLQGGTFAMSPACPLAGPAELLACPMTGNCGATVPRVPPPPGGLSTPVLTCHPTGECGAMTAASPVNPSGDTGAPARHAVVASLASPLTGTAGGMLSLCPEALLAGPQGGYPPSPRAHTPPSDEGWTRVVSKREVFGLDSSDMAWVLRHQRPTGTRKHIQ